MLSLLAISLDLRHVGIPFASWMPRSDLAMAVGPSDEGGGVMDGVVVGGGGDGDASWQLL